MVLSNAILQNDPRATPRLGHNLTMSRKEHTQIPQQLLGVSYSWGDMADAAADIYSGVSIYIGPNNINLLTDAGDSSCFGPF